MVYAQVKDGIVQNCIVLADAASEPLFKEGFDELIRIDQLDIRPSIGFSYDGQNFQPPINEG